MAQRRQYRGFKYQVLGYCEEKRERYLVTYVFVSAFTVYRFLDPKVGYCPMPLLRFVV